MSTASLIQEYISDNLEHLREKVADLKVMRGELIKQYPVFDKIIREQYIKEKNKILVDDISSNLSVDAESVIIILEEFGDQLDV